MSTFETAKLSFLTFALPGIKTSSKNIIKFEFLNETIYQLDKSLSTTESLKTSARLKVDKESLKISKCNKKFGYRSGRLETEYEKLNGVKHGKYILYDACNGDVYREFSYVNNVLHGEYIEYYPGKIKSISCNYVNGTVNGLYTIYYYNGKIKSTTTYVNSVLHGKITRYHDNGNIKLEGFYNNSVEVGKWTIYDHTGVVQGYEYYREEPHD